MTNLQDKVAIITGASRGIGAQSAIKLAELGAKVVVNYANSPQAAEAVTSSIMEKGGQAIAVKADVSSLKEIEYLFETTISHFGKVDILVNNAGIMHTIPISEVTEEQFDQHFAINVKGTYFACQQAFKHMAPNGRIVNFSTSVAGVMFPGYSIYAATKGAVEQISRQLAREFGPKNITINTIAPGPTTTELFLEGKTPEQLQALKGNNAFGRFGETNDIADALAFLVSDESRWITGQTIRVNGGMI
ncbi:MULTISPECIES: SDR family oxidoreductase [Bacillaceae]|uniref:SDR family oxidoreductase n=1 Tax=Bacillaceae TaxID=186817 RepID=UPI001E53CEE7|nr:MULTISPECIES: SDR family oxidoreductase [Bacillaceae]MCE4050341.1 SDR family oxidoreductase [Bacillus sp. Au-Bac7]MCM3029576.1 SDR family oxidoreductase [Niallia sp. MER 6]